MSTVIGAIISLILTVAHMCSNEIIGHSQNRVPSLGSWYDMTPKYPKYRVPRSKSNESRPGWAALPPGVEF